MNKSEYMKMLEGLSCPACGGRLNIVSPPTTIVRGEDELLIPGRAKCPACGDEWEFTHYFQCPACGYWESAPTHQCPHCGHTMEPFFDFRPPEGVDVDFCKCKWAICLIISNRLANPPSCPLEPGRPVGYLNY